VSERILEALHRVCTAGLAYVSRRRYEAAIRKRNAANMWFVCLALFLSACSVTVRAIRAERHRCDVAMNAAAEISEQAIHDEADRCRANLDRIESAR